MAIAHNPANDRNKEEVVRTRIPMDLPQLKLEVPEIPGYRLYWFRSEPGRIARAERAGYEYVQREEIELNSVGLADDRLADGNTDMAVAWVMAASVTAVDSSNSAGMGTVTSSPPGNPNPRLAITILATSCADFAFMSAEIPLLRA